MSKTDRKFVELAASAVTQLALFVEGEVQLTETQFEGHWDTVTELLEEANNHRYRFGRSIPRSE